MHFFSIWALISLGTSLLQVESVFYLEFTVKEKVRRQLDFETSKNLLFECEVDETALRPYGERAPVKCTLVTQLSKKLDIYTSKNFFVVWRPKLSFGQAIEYVDLPFKGLPDNLFLAVSYDPLDYPEFSERAEYEIFGGKPGESDRDEVEQYHSICNIRFLRDSFDQLRPSFLEYQQRLKKLTDDYWQKFSVKPEPGQPKMSKSKTLSNSRASFNLRSMSLNSRNNLQLAPQSSLSTHEIVNDKIAKHVVGFLTKMIDPCFIKALVDSSKSRYTKKRISSSDAYEYCHTMCRFLAVAPLVLRKQVATQCQDLNSGKCDGKICTCLSASGAKVTMAECNNRVVSVSGTGLISRFTPPPSTEDPRISTYLELDPSFVHSLTEEGPSPYPDPSKARFGKLPAVREQKEQKIGDIWGDPQSSQMKAPVRKETNKRKSSCLNWLSRKGR